MEQSQGVENGRRLDLALAGGYRRFCIFRVVSGLNRKASAGGRAVTGARPACAGSHHWPAPCAELDCAIFGAISPRRDLITAIMEPILK